ncbi:MAG: transposase [Lachnospira eligens]
MSKRGSRVLRYTLVNAAWNIIRNNATFEAYYNAKMTECWSLNNDLGIALASLSESSGRCSLTK